MNCFNISKSGVSVICVFMVKKSNVYFSSLLYFLLQALKCDLVSTL